MKQSEQINELAKALAQAQLEIRGAVKDSENPFFKSSYADLASVWESCHAALNKNGLAVIQVTEVEGEYTFLVTLLTHSSGQWISGRYPVRPQKPDPQALGAALTYARRYALAAMVGVAAIEDDDGESAMDRTQKPKPTHNEPVAHRGEDGAYIVPFGNQKGTQLRHLERQQIRESILYWREREKMEKKKLTGKPLEFVETAERYMETLEKRMEVPNEPS